MLSLYSSFISRMKRLSCSVGWKNPIRRISLIVSIEAQLSMWCWTSGRPAIGKRGFGMSRERGRNRVPWNLKNKFKNARSLFYLSRSADENHSFANHRFFSLKVLPEKIACKKTWFYDFVHDFLSAKLLKDVLRCVLVPVQKVLQGGATPHMPTPPKKTSWYRQSFANKLTLSNSVYYFFFK